ncbi:MAG: NAD(P)-dependent oxidoreductase [Gammaproteobacteria bacterium]|nr:NAD(P)-dependent oxidoreductase [Gammaproteobacteria bacterium]MDH5591836.1 NAD(P)-dependent oxidoreductase [Gammaproteobacteria bacterium]
MNISLLGIGLMGQALAKHLLDEGQQLTVFNRSPEKTVELHNLGATVVLTAQDAVNNSDFCILMLSDAEAINTVVDSIDPDTFKDKIFIQMGTISPDESRAIARRITDCQGSYLECPVLGSLPEATSGTLILMAGGSSDDFQAALPLLKIIGKNPQHIGDIGQGATVKLAMNQLIAGLTTSFSLSLALVEKEGIEVEQFMKIVRDSALYAPTFDKKLERMLQRDYSNPNFPTKHLAKDTRLFLSVAKQLGLETCALEGIKQLLEKTLAKGLADTDYSAIYAGINKDQ